MTVEKPPKFVKIIKCSYPQGWYNSLIGEVFGVDNASGHKDYVLWEDYAGNSVAWRHIAHEDCIEVENPNDQ